MYTREEYIERMHIPIQYDKLKQTVWYLNNTSYFIYDEACVKNDSKAHREIKCSKKRRGLKTEFIKLIKNKLKGDNNVLELFCEDECDTESLELKRSKLCFNACEVFMKKKYCTLAPDKKYDKLLELLSLDVNKLGDLIKMGFLLCTLIPCTQYEKEKLSFQLEKEKSLVWEMIVNYATEKNLSSGIGKPSIDFIIELIGGSRALDEIFGCPVDKLDKNLLLKLVEFDIDIREAFEVWLEYVEKSWDSIKLDYGIEIRE